MTAANPAVKKAIAKPPSQPAQQTKKPSALAPVVVVADEPKVQIVKQPTAVAPAPKLKQAEVKCVKKDNNVHEVTKQLEKVELTSDRSDPTIEISKKLKRLRKKLRDSEQLNDKIKSGEVVAEKVQLDKIARIVALEKEIEELEEERLKLRSVKK